MGNKCLGAPSGEACVFGPFAGPATPKPGNWHCSWCDPKLLEAVLAKPNGKARMKQLCANFSDKIKKRALCKLPKKCTRSFNRRKKPRPRRQRRQLKHPGKKEAPVASHRKQPPNDDEPIEDDGSRDADFKRSRKHF